MILLPPGFSLPIRFTSPLRDAFALTVRLSITKLLACPQNPCRPPRGFTRASPYPWLDRLASGLAHVTPRTFMRRPSLLAGMSLSLRMLLSGLSSPHRQTPWHVIQNERYNSEEQYPAIAIRFQVLFTPCQGFFSTFPHGTGALSDSERI